MEFYSLINAQCEYNFSMMTMATTIAKESGHGMKNGWATDSNSCQSFQPLFKLELSWCSDTILLRIHNFWWFNSIFHGWVWEYITYDVRVGDVHCAYNKIEDGTDREEKKNGESNKMIYTVAAWEQIWMECIPFAVAYTSSNVIYRITCRPWAFDQEIHRKTNHLGAKTNQEEQSFRSEFNSIVLAAFSVLHSSHFAVNEIWKRGQDFRVSSGFIVCVCRMCACVCKVNCIAIILIIWLLEKGRQRKSL